MKKYYEEDLAYIHDVGHAEFALRSAPGILEILERSGIRDGLVADLGCGSGLWAQRLIEAGYDVLGIDISEAMIRIAQRRAPAAEFRIESLHKAELPLCNAVTSISECLNYLFDPRNERSALPRLFGRVYSSLSPGGLFVFDIGEPGQVAEGVVTRGFSEGEDWVVLVEKKEQQGILTRRITTFRKVGNNYRRADETHVQRLYKAADVAKELRRAGFRVRTARSYGRYDLPKGHAAFIARKPV
ncbi:MAG TPA: class I SAM-dependent methyltransferase [Blastocatellia bacterium]|nr:class I SAM-dependent methyltransferase [Blastocatellia bacterium]